MATNKKLGNTFEAELCETLFQKGFWAHNLAQNQAGQPADVLAVRNGVAYLIDCKVCSDNKFALSRVEENQSSAMELWRDSGNGEGWFALKIEDDVVMITYANMRRLSRTKSTLTWRDYLDCGIPLERWISQCE